MGTSCTKNAAKEPQRQPAVTQVAAKEHVAPPVKQEKDDDSVSTSPSKKDEDVNDLQEYAVCQVDDLKDNQMKVYEAGDTRVLLVRENGEFSALGTKCSHYGAPLNTGIVCNGRVWCPWHGACFNSKTGDIEDFPALDPIPRYPVRIDSKTNEVKVTTSLKGVFEEKANRPLCKRDSSTNKAVVIIGSGGAGHSCAETLRQEGFTGRVVIITKENCIPYDRPKLSKAMTMDAAKLALRSRDYYENGDIEIMEGVEATGVEMESKTVQLSSGEVVPFTHLVIATGGRPRPLPCPGTHLKNVCLLRDAEDANYIAKQGAGNNVVIVGTSFIGMEVAAFLADKAASVTVIGRSEAPFSHVLGPVIGRALQQLHESKGVRFILGTEVGELQGDDEGNLSEVLLTSGQVLPADLLVAGLGVIPCTEFLRSSDITLNNKGFVPVDEYMRTNCENVYAAGDIASFPLYGQQERPVAIGHWQMALHHGRNVALDIVGRGRKISETAVPFFWTSMFGKSVRYAGHVTSFDDVVIHGDVEQLHFAAFYCSKGVVKAVATLNFDPLAVQFAALLTQKKQLLKEDIVSDPKAWLHKLN